VDDRNEVFNVTNAIANLDIINAFIQSSIYGASMISDQIKNYNCAEKLLDEKHCYSANKFYTIENFPTTTKPRAF